MLSQAKGRVLVVDDDELGAELLRNILEPRGHDVSVAHDGQEALELLRQPGYALPDTILLDVLMPRMDGLATCRALKANRETAYIPVLVVTGLAESEDRIRGIEAGANDYLVKPLDPREVALRVGNSVSLKQLHDQTIRQLEERKRIESFRDSLVDMVVHDLRQPLTSISGIAEYLSMGPAEGPNLRMMKSIRQITKRMDQMIASLLDVSKMENGKFRLSPEICDLDSLVAEVAADFGAPIRSDLSIRVESIGPSMSVECDVPVFRRVVSNLIDNAVKNTPGGAEVLVRVEYREIDCTVSVIDSGSGIPAEFKDKIFEKFGQVEAFTHGLRASWGLGLTFCRMAVEAHGGRIEVESTVGKGSTFRIVIPKSQTMSHVGHGDQNG